MSRKPQFIIGLALLLTGGFAQAEDYPNKVITLVVPFSAGGPTDTVARFIAQPMSKQLGQTIIVENVGGAVQSVMDRSKQGITPVGRYRGLLSGAARLFAPLL